MPVGPYIYVKNGSQGFIPCFDLIQISRSHCCGHFIIEQRISSGGHWLYVPKCYCMDRLSKIGKTSVVSQVGPVVRNLPAYVGGVRGTGLIPVSGRSFE